MSAGGADAVADLLAAALAERDDEDACSEHVEKLRAHPDSAAVLAAVAPLVEDPEPHVREVAIDVYGWAGVRGITNDDRQERVERLLALLDAGESEWRVLESIAYAWERLWVEEGAVRIAAFAGHPHERVRGAVAQAVGHAEDPAAVAALVKLSADSVGDIRDWATFGLAEQHSASRETPEVTAALAARLADPHVGARDEAIYGLAVRRDPRAIDPLVALVRDGVDARQLSSSLVILAATFPDDPRLIAALPVHFPDGIVPDDLRRGSLSDLETYDEWVAEGDA